MTTEEQIRLRKLLYSPQREPLIRKLLEACDKVIEECCQEHSSACECPACEAWCKLSRVRRELEE
jgi:hypothetical protein